MVSQSAEMSPRQEDSNFEAEQKDIIYMSFQTPTVIHNLFITRYNIQDTRASELVNVLQ